MTISGITGVTAEGQPKEIASFLRSGVPYVVWTDFAGGGVGAFRKVRWKPHTGVDFSEVIPTVISAFNSITAAYHLASDSVVVAWDDGLAKAGSADGNILIAKFNVTTGAILSGPTTLCPGSQPRLTYRTASTNDMLLYYKTLRNGGVYGRTSNDGGSTWQSGAPLITNQVLDTDYIKVIPYDATHVSIAQTGRDARGLSEISLFKRTRPIRSIVKHPTVAGQFFLGEPSKFDNTTLTDNQRGELALSTDNTKLYHLDGVVQGTSDTINAVALMAVSGTTMSVSASAGPVGGVAGRNFVQYSLTPAQTGLNVTLPGATSYAVDFATSAAYGYVAEYSDSTTAGQLVVVDLATGTTGTPLSGIAGVRAVSVANFISPAVIFVATTESGVERLRVYQESALTPTLLLNVKIPARANNVTVSAGPGAPVAARLYLSMTNTFGVFDYYSAAQPVRLVDAYTFSGGGQFYHAELAANGNIFVAAGNAGVIVFNSAGRVLTQIRVSGEPLAEWRPATTYALNSLVVPRASSSFTGNRYYFKATTGGTSGNSEPAWALTGTVSDSTTVWTPQGTIDGVVTDIALDTTTKRIYAAGVAGGNLGTDGRVWMISAGGLL